MTDINQVVLVGRLARDPEIKYTQSGLCILKGCIVVNSTKKDGDSYADNPNFIDFTIFGKLASSLGQYMAKGKQLSIAGNLSQERWESEGQKRSKLQVIVNQVQLLGSKSQGGDVI